MYKSKLVIILVLFNLNSVFCYAGLVKYKEGQTTIGLGSSQFCYLFDEAVNCIDLYNPDNKIELPVLVHPKQISVGAAHACALDDEGVKCWGKEAFGEISMQPKLKNPRMVTAGANHTCAIDDDGIKCWGYSGEHLQNYTAPFLSNPQSVFVGAVNFCAINNNKMTCWGNDKYGQVSNFPSLNNPIDISMYSTHACAINSTGAKCWGDGDFFQNVPLLIKPRQISIAINHVCALDDTGVKCWGKDEYGQVSKIPKLINPKQISSNGWSTCALDDEGVKCWGRDEFGSLKKLSQINFNAPVFRDFSSTNTFLSNLSTFSYKFDRDYLISLYQLSLSIKTSESIKYLIMTSLLPYLQNFGYPGVKEKYLDHAVENILAENVKLGINSLSDIDQTKHTISAAVQMLLVSLKTSISLLSTEDKKTSEFYIAEIGKLVSGELKFSDVTRFLEQHGSRLEQHFIKLSQNDYLTGREATDMLILNYLRGL